jgi:hypothetical protein
MIGCKSQRLYGHVHIGKTKHYGDMYRFEISKIMRTCTGQKFQRLKVHVQGRNPKDYRNP